MRAVLCRAWGPIETLTVEDVPAPFVDKAQKFRRWYRARILELFENVDAIIAPATPCVAPKLGEQILTIDGVDLPLRANIGIYTQPISFIGLPVAAVPVPLSPLPIGVTDEL